MRIQEKKMANSAIKTTLFLALSFLITVNETMSFVQNTLFHLIENGAKKSLFSNQSSIKILILRINSIASRSNSNINPKVGCLFTLILGFEFLRFYPQLINKLQISSINP
jgi:hypothetical protein